MALLRLRERLWKHYKIKRSDPHFRAKGAEVWNLTKAMIGTEDNPKLAVKAAEARGLLDLTLFRATSARFLAPSSSLCECAAVVSRYLKLELSFGASRGGSIAPRLFGHPLEST